MKKSLLVAGSLFLLVACMSNQVANEQSKTNQLPNNVDTIQTSTKPVWQPLLDDNSLSQWQQLGGSAPYHVEDNIIVGTTIPSNQNSFLATKQIFSDFIFEVDVKASAGINSGIQFRSNSLADYHQGRVHGYQMEIDTSSRKWSGGIFDEARSGWLYNLSRNPNCQNQFKVDEWNTYRIEAIGHHLRTFINNVPCADLIDEQSASGFIALQIHSAGHAAKGKQVKWRDPRVLTDDVEKFISKANNDLQISYLNNQLTAFEKAHDWRLLWDGKTTINPAWSITDQSLFANTAANLAFDINEQNFEFELDIKVGDHLDGAIHYLLEESALNDTALSTSSIINSPLSFKLADDKLNPLAKDAKQSFAAVTGKVAPSNFSEPDRQAKREKGKWGWNRVRIHVALGKVTHWLNNVKVAEFNLEKKQQPNKSILVIALNKGAANIRNIKLRKITINPGDRAGHVMKEVVPRDLIPQAPILSVAQALKTFKVHPDFELEVVASEPLLFDPVAAIYDAAGRIWALEMTTYMLDTKATGEMKHESQIVVLSDTDQDGTMDKRQVIVEKILLPRALAFIEGGILWADNEQLYFSEISEKNNTIKLIKTDVVDSDYAKGGNIEHKPNALLYSLDNWYYNAKSSQRYRPYPLSAQLPKGAKEVYRNGFWKMARSQTEYRGQWGLTQDDYGRHYFNYNFTPLLTTSFLPNVATRNPKHKFPDTLTQQKVGSNDVYPIRVTPGINRGYMKDMYADGYKLKTHTAACGPLIYRGNQFPKEYYGMGLAQEPAGNLMKATKITENNGMVSGENLLSQQEILASTDERFRPVNAINAPDGTITVVDFYHGILQHRTFLTSYLNNQIKMRDLERNKHIGRLYRLKHKNSKMPKVTYLNKLSAEQLVPYLAHDNGWHRDTAKQLIVMKQDKSVIELLTNMAITSTNHLAQINALWTLEGLGVVDLKTLQQAAKTNNAKVKRSIYRLAEYLPNNNQVLNNWLMAEAKQANKELANVLVLAAGTHQAWPVISILINRFGVNDFTYAALAFNEANFLTAEQQNIPSAATSNIRKLVNTNVQSKTQSLTGEALKSFNRGKALYNGEIGCFGCHGAEGKGNEMIPPLDESEWVTESKERLIAILLRGLSGPVTVNGKKFTSPLTMPGLGENHDVSDQNLADIATFIRNAWSNQASTVTAKDIDKVRQLTEQQSIPYTETQLKSDFKK